MLFVCVNSILEIERNLTNWLYPSIKLLQQHSVLFIIFRINRIFNRLLCSMELVKKKQCEAYLCDSISR